MILPKIFPSVCDPSLCSPSGSYLLNYRIQSHMYVWLDNVTEESSWLRAEGMTICCVSTVITIVLRIVAIGEVFFKGAYIFCTSPWATNPLDNAKKGLDELFNHTKNNIFNAIYIPFEFFDAIISILIEPKKTIILITECMKIHLNHSESGTLKTNQHIKELQKIKDLASYKFDLYQQRVVLRNHIKRITNNGFHNQSLCDLCKIIQDRGQDLGRATAENEIRRMYEIIIS